MRGPPLVTVLQFPAHLHMRMFTGVASNFPLPSPEGGIFHLGHFCANTEGM